MMQKLVVVRAARAAAPLARQAPRRLHSARATNGLFSNILQAAATRHVARCRSSVGSPWILSRQHQRLTGARLISSTRAVWHGDESEFEGAPTVKVHWKNKHGDVRTVDAPVGMNLMRVAHKFGIELEGACEGVCACSTCHVILEDSVYEALPEPSEDEDDMLDQAFGLTSTSRLGCQVEVMPAMDGITVTLPAATRNFYVDGHVPQPH